MALLPGYLNDDAKMTDTSTIGITNSCQLVAPVYTQYAEELKGYLQKKLRDKAISEEVLSDVMLKVYKSCKKIPEVENVRSWLYRITHNALMDYFREQQKAGKEELKEVALDEEENVYHSMEALLPAMIRMLPEENREAVQWSDLENVPQKEIAERLGISLSGAKSRIQRGRVKLRELFFECTYMDLDSRGIPLSFSIKGHCTPLLPYKDEVEVVSVKEGEGCRVSCDCDNAIE